MLIVIWGTKTPQICLGVGFQDKAIRKDAVAFMEPDLGMDLPKKWFCQNEIPGYPKIILRLPMTSLYPSCVQCENQLDIIISIEIIKTSKKKNKPPRNIEEAQEKP